MFAVEATALDHEAVDDAMEDRAVVEAVLHVLQEVLDGHWRLVGVKFDDDGAQAGLQFDHRVRGPGRNRIEHECGQRASSCFMRQFLQ